MIGGKPEVRQAPDVRPAASATRVAAASVSTPGWKSARSAGRSPARDGPAGTLSTKRPGGIRASDVAAVAVGNDPPAAEARCRPDASSSVRPRNRPAGRVDDAAGELAVVVKGEADGRAASRIAQRHRRRRVVRVEPLRHAHADAIRAGTAALDAKVSAASVAVVSVSAVARDGHRDVGRRLRRSPVVLPAGRAARGNTRPPMCPAGAFPCFTSRA